MMKNRRTYKLTALVLSLVFIMSSSVFAELKPKEYTISALTNNKEVFCGEQVSVLIQIDGNSFEGETIVLSYNKDVFSFDNADNALDGFIVYNNSNEGVVSIEYRSTESQKAGSVIAELVFEAKQVNQPVTAQFKFLTARAGDTAYTYIGDWPEAKTVACSVVVCNKADVNVYIVPDYVNGKSLVLVKGVDGALYSIGGCDMYETSYFFGSSVYNCAYIVDGAISKASVLDNIKHSYSSSGKINKSCDVSGNGKITKDDAQFVFDAMNKKSTVTMIDMLKSDVNGDGHVDSIDINTILINAK